MTSICGLGMVAAKPLETTLAFFRDDVERHLAANTAGGAP
jgi:NADH:ubiquinone oxidoreductase subunit F (NADH-binding)